VCDESIGAQGFHYIEDARAAALEYTELHKVLHTTKRTQLVAVHLKEGEELKAEVHEDKDQVFIIQDGSGVAYLGFGKRKTNRALQPGTLLLVPAGIQHRIVATKGGLAFQTLYSPPDSFFPLP
jgi:mannose-6-phosphate isomerase-like protein (cupin superfamily)